MAGWGKNKGKEEATVRKIRILAALACLCLTAGLCVPAQGAERTGTPKAGIVAQGTCGKDGADLTWTLEADGVLTIRGNGEMEDYSYHWELESSTPEVLPPTKADVGEERELPPWLRYVSSLWDPWGGSPDLVVLQKIVIEEGVASIGASAFSTCLLSSAQVQIPGSVRSIGDAAFLGTQLPAVTIPEGVERIGTGAFKSCDMVEVTIPSTVKYIGGCAFSTWMTPGIRMLKKISVSEGNTNHRAVDGVLYNMDMTELVQYPEGKEGTSFVVPSTVKRIGADAFACAGLASVTLPEGLEEIGWGAFAYNEALTEIRLPDSVRTVGDYAFARCHALASAALSADLEEIGIQAFYGTGLWRVRIPPSVEHIKFGAFWCPDLACVYIPKSVVSIDLRGLSDGPWLDIYYEGGEEDWKKISIDEDAFSQFFGVTFHYHASPSQPLEIPVWIVDTSSRGTSIQYNGPFLPQETMVLAASLSGGRFRGAALGTYGGSRGRFDFGTRLEEGCRLFFLDPQTLIPLSEPTVLMGPR